MASIPSPLHKHSCIDDLDLLFQVNGRKGAKHQDKQSKPAAVGPPYTCPCSKKFKNGSTYRRHMDLSHTTNPPKLYKCTYYYNNNSDDCCGKSFGSEHTLQMHMSTHQGLTGSASKTKMDISSSMNGNGKSVGNVIITETPRVAQDNAQNGIHENSEMPVSVQNGVPDTAQMAKIKWANQINHHENDQQVTVTLFEHSQDSVPHLVTSTVEVSSEPMFNHPAKAAAESDKENDLHKNSRHLPVDDDEEEEDEEEDDAKVRKSTRLTGKVPGWKTGYRIPDLIQDEARETPRPVRKRRASRPASLESQEENELDAAVLSIKAQAQKYDENIKRRKSSEERFPCDLCSKSFASQKYWSMHRATHITSQSPTDDDLKNGEHKTEQDGYIKQGNSWICKICAKLFAQNSSFRNHMRTHSDERPYVCEVCVIGFKEKYHLQKHHLHKHTTERNKQCRFCDKKFKDATGLRAHERIHSEYRPYKCRNCAKAFKTSECLWHHENRSKVCGLLAKNFPPQQRVRRGRKVLKQDEEEMEAAVMGLKPQPIYHMQSNETNTPAVITHQDAKICHPAYPQPVPQQNTAINAVYLVKEEPNELIQEVVDEVLHKEKLFDCPSEFEDSKEDWILNGDSDIFMEDEEILKSEEMKEMSSYYSTMEMTSQPIATSAFEGLNTQGPLQVTTASGNDSVPTLSATLSDPSANIVSIELYRPTAAPHYSNVSTAQNQQVVTSLPPTISTEHTTAHPNPIHLSMPSITKALGCEYVANPTQQSQVSYQHTIRNQPLITTVSTPKPTKIHHVINQHSEQMKPVIANSYSNPMFSPMSKIISSQNNAAKNTIHVSQPVLNLPTPRPIPSIVPSTPLAKVNCIAAGKKATSIFLSQPLTEKIDLIAAALKATQKSIVPSQPLTPADWVNAAKKATPKLHSSEAQQAINAMISGDSLKDNSNATRGKMSNFVCPMCDKGYADKRAFQNHLARHEQTVGKPYRCNICQFGFKLKVHLKKHNLYKHCEEYPVECSICAKKFKDSSAVRLHERIHSENRPFSCKCGKHFKTKENLWGHQKRKTKKNNVCSVGKNGECATLPCGIVTIQSIHPPSSPESEAESVQDKYTVRRSSSRQSTTPAPVFTQGPGVDITSVCSPTTVSSPASASESVQDKYTVRRSSSRQAKVNQHYKILQYYKQQSTTPAPVFTQGPGVDITSVCSPTTVSSPASATSPSSSTSSLPSFEVLTSGLRASGGGPSDCPTLHTLLKKDTNKTTTFLPGIQHLFNPSLRPVAPAGVSPLLSPGTQTQISQMYDSLYNDEQFLTSPHPPPPPYKAPGTVSNAAAASPPYSSDLNSRCSSVGPGTPGSNSSEFSGMGSDHTSDSVLPPGIWMEEEASPVDENAAVVAYWTNEDSDQPFYDKSSYVHQNRLH